MRQELNDQLLKEISEGQDQLIETMKGFEHTYKANDDAFKVGFKHLFEEMRILNARINEQNDILRMIFKQLHDKK